MRPLTVYGDAAAALANYVRDELADRPEPYAAGVTVGTRRPTDHAPKDHPVPLVLIRQDGPGRVMNRANVAATIRAAIWHATEDDAFDLAQLVHAITSNHSGPVVRSVIDGLSPYVDADPDTGEPLASFTVTANVRARLIT